MEKVTAYKKDPKKVAAGHAGAAARIKNQQVFLNKKRDAKHAVLAPEHVGTVEQLSVGTTTGNMRLIIGVVGVGALLLILAALRSGQRKVPTMQLKVEKQEDIPPCLFTDFK